MSTFNPGTYQSGDGNLNEPITVGRLGQPVKFGGGTEWFNIGSSESLLDRPSAADFFPGAWTVGRNQYVSNGSSWILTETKQRIYPSSYVAIKSATTTVAGQSEKIASGAFNIYVKNIDATNTVKIGFGTDYTTAESAAAASTDIAAPHLEFNFPVPAGKTHYSWLGVGGTVLAVIGQAE